MLGRPHEPKIETANDADTYVSNFWRATTYAPDEVAYWADWPVNEVDLHARHKWLVSRVEFRERLRADPDYYDAKIAGWWVWGICQWIGSGWCVEPNNHKHPKLDGIGKGVHSNAGHSMPNMVRAQHPSAHLSQQLPALRVGSGATGNGVHSSAFLRESGIPSLGNDRGLNGVSAPTCTEWFRAIQNRLRRVRFACGDFTRVLGPSVLGKGKNVGGRKPCAVFLDPPYSHEFREPFLYTEDDSAVAKKAREWAVEHGDDPELRVALCGYWDEHRELMPANWTSHRWRGARGYAGDDNDNRDQETIWFSPHCLAVDEQVSMFGVGT